MSTQDNTIRLDKYLADHGYTSRRGADQFLASNKVEVNNRHVKVPGTRINPQTDTIIVNGQQLESAPDIYLLLNKPTGYTSTTKPQDGEKTVLELLPKDHPLHLIGRLDKETTGLIIATNDGNLTYRLTHPKFHVEKTYQLTLSPGVRHRDFKMLEHGVRLKGYKTKPAKLEVVQKDDEQVIINLTLTEGKHHQVRRMCRALNLNLLSLSRIAFGDITDSELNPGQYRPLTSEEISSLKNL